VACKTIELALIAPIDLERIQQTVVYYSNRKFYAEIYQNGTCVFPPISKSGVVQNGKGRLMELGSRHVDFVVKEMDDHNFVIRFNDYVFSIVFADEYLENRDQIRRHASSSNGDEMVVGALGSVSDHFLIGLYARTRLFEDVREPELARSIRPSLDARASR
jgi:hypothetical protein